MRPSRLQSFSLGIILGAAVGAVVALVFAPSTGATTRRTIRARLTDVASVAKGVAERAEHAADVLGDRVEHYLGRDEELARRKVREIREGMRRYTDTHAGA